ncbi:hypothetical protein LX16_1172 [Stackebrandtia albiflava]|uniref:Tetratricopeptide repeat protein n=1 Tax=Stackebrandtia albiflava TaxID=406432 RepID=A0A562VC77_9ACTN|nr:hypothetical protein [Stackebrandtia albiflava]TWJ15462.1 hypothetical protein LX16_1172 [Stackebrandtia albiflava]
MDATDLDRRARTEAGCIPPSLVARLLERGHLDRVEFHAVRGEWFCAREWVRLLGARDRWEEASAVLAPYVATGWWPAARAQAEVLEAMGQVEEAIALARPYAESVFRALEFFARLLARHGRADEAVTELITGIDDWFLATALVEVADGTGRDEEVAALLADRIRPGHRCVEPWCCRGLDSDTALELLAVIRERQRRVDEAIALLRRRQLTSVDNRDRLTDLLARHDRIEELRAYAAEDSYVHATRRLAALLEERGDVEGAIASYRRPGASAADEPHGAVELAELLLARHGRDDEAIEVMCAVVDAPGGVQDWLVDILCTRYAESGRARDGIAHLDRLAARYECEQDWDLLRNRLPLMAASGMLDEAVTLARPHSESDPYAAQLVADLLAAAGRVADAVAVLEPHGISAGHALAGYLVDLGRVDDAVALFQQRDTAPAELLWRGTLRPEPF